MNRVVYLHGFASGPLSNKAQYFKQRFAELYGLELEIPDLAEGRFEALTITGQLEVVDRAVAGGRVAMMGSSLGGYLAALYAAAHPDLVDRVVLLAPAFDFARRWAESLGAERLAEWRRTGWLEVYHYGERRECRLGYGLLEDAGRYAAFPDVRQPALVFHGGAG